MRLTTELFWCGVRKKQLPIGSNTWGVAAGGQGGQQPTGGSRGGATHARRAPGSPVTATARGRGIVIGTPARLTGQHLKTLQPSSSGPLIPSLEGARAQSTRNLAPVQSRSWVLVGVANGLSQPAVGGAGGRPRYPGTSNLTRGCTHELQLAPLRGIGLSRVSA